MTTGDAGATPDEAGADARGELIRVIREIHGQEPRIRQGFKLHPVPGSVLPWD